MCRLLGGSTREEMLTSCLPKRIVPEEGVINPAIVRRKVVLPQPEGPSTAAKAPDGTTIDKLSTMGLPLK